jgi:hypothetical protein
MMGLAVSPSPSPDPGTRLSAALDQAHDCNPIAMDRRNVEPLIALVDHERAPLLEIVDCNGRVEKLKNGYAARSWAAFQCGNARGRKLQLELDEKGRMRRIHFMCN